MGSIAFATEASNREYLPLHDQVTYLVMGSVPYLCVTLANVVKVRMPHCA